MEVTEVGAKGFRLAETRAGREVGRAYLYICFNDLHSEPFGLLEDVAVDENFRSEGVGGSLVRAVIARAKDEGCYKLIATSRSDGTRQAVHEWYLRLGFTAYGTEFRMDL